MAIHEHPIYRQIEPNATLWRYLSYDKLCLLLTDRALFFCRADKFSDIYEGSIPRLEAENRIKEDKRAANFYGRPFDEPAAWQRIKDRGAFHQSFKKATIVNCWHINEHESDGMWHLYMDDNEGVAIQTTGARVMQTMLDVPEAIEMSKVRYIDYDSDIWFHREEFPHWSYNMITPLIHKRIEFAHEREFRLFQVIDEATNQPNFWQPKEKGRQLAVNLETLIERIVLHPTADDDARVRVEALLAAANLNAPVSFSGLSSEPFY